MICIVSVPLCCLSCKALTFKSLCYSYSVFLSVFLSLCIPRNNVSQCVNTCSSGYAGKRVSVFVGFLSGNLLWSSKMLCSGDAGIKVSLTVCLFAESLGGEIQSFQRWSRCYSTSSHQCSPTPQRTYSISALETTRSKLRFVSACIHLCFHWC